jgi:rhodanese-related sulfurtransferase
LRNIASVVFVATLAAIALPSTPNEAQGQAPCDTPPATAAQVSKPKKLTRAEFDALRAEPDQLLVLDVRRPSELGSIGGLPVYQGIHAREIEKSLAAIPKDRMIVAVSNHAARATRAADLLTQCGFTVAGAIGAQDYEDDGGTADWGIEVSALVYP